MGPMCVFVWVGGGGWGGWGGGKDCISTRRLSTPFSGFFFFNSLHPNLVSPWSERDGTHSLLTWGLDTIFFLSLFLFVGHSKQVRHGHSKISCVGVFGVLLLGLLCTELMALEPNKNRHSDMGLLAA